MGKVKDKSIGEIIRQFRQLKHLTQEELADLLNASYQTIQKYEYGKTIPPFDKIVKISRILEIPHDVFFNDNVRSDLLTKLKNEIANNYSFIKMLDESPELNEMVKYYVKNKSSFKGIDIFKLLKDISNIPKNKKDAFLSAISSISRLSN